MKISWKQSLVSRYNNLVITAKNYTKVDIKFFWSCQILLDFFTPLQKMFSKNVALFIPNYKNDIF